MPRMASFDWPAVQATTRAEWLRTSSRSAPGLFAWLEGLPHAVRWRDVLFVHGGLPPGRRLEDLGLTTDEHLWIRSGFFDTPWDDAGFDAIGRPASSVSSSVTRRSAGGPTLFHDGHSLDIDTNAVGNPRMPARPSRS